MPSSDENRRCRVCGLLYDDPPWGPDGRTPKFEYCDCCGVEWGYQDATAEGARRFRQQWIEAGAKWSRPDRRPADWNLEAQLRHVPAAFRQGGVAMVTTYLHAVASLDGYIADERDDVGPLHDGYVNGERPLVDEDHPVVHGAPCR